MEISGVIPRNLTGDDVRRIRALEAVIATLGAAEREAYLYYGSQEPERAQRRYQELLQKLHRQPALSDPAILRRARRGEPLHLDMYLEDISAEGIEALERLLCEERLRVELHNDS